MFFFDKNDRFAHFEFYTTCVMSCTIQTPEYSVGLVICLCLVVICNTRPHCSVEQVLHVNGSSAKLMGKLRVPAQKVSSVTFGGPQLDKLYVTTLSRGVPAEKFNEFPMTGKVLEVSGLEVRGTPNRRVREKCFRLL